MRIKGTSPITQNALFRALFCSTELKKNILCTVRENILNMAIFKKKLVINCSNPWIIHYFNIIMC